MSSFPLERREAIVRAVLADTRSASVCAAEVGVSREAVRKVRHGMMWADVLPHLPRMDRTISGRTCNQCEHFAPGRCLLEIPEFASSHRSGYRFARYCPSFVVVRTREAVAS